VAILFIIFICICFRSEYISTEVTPMVLMIFLRLFQYGGNPVSCAIANAVFDTIEKENLREHALVVGEYFFDSCQMLSKKHSCIGDVRGVGLFLGIELVKDREERTPDKETATYVVKR
jgi:4-aminobutyrate aminotransferase-like enzyme